MSRYKYTATTLTDALLKLFSGVEEKSKEGLKFLSMASRCELFGKAGNTIEIRQWFIEPDHLNPIIEAFYHTPDSKTKWEIISTLYSVYTRYITHPAILNHPDIGQDENNKPLCANFRDRLYELASESANCPDSAVQEVSASILAEMGCSRAWEIFCDVLRKRHSSRTISRLIITILRYFNDENRQNSMTLNQRENLIEAIDNVICTSKNKRVVTDLKDALKYLQNREKRNNIQMASQPQN